MQLSFFRQVKEAFASQAESMLSQVGINLKHGLKGEWSGCLCPLCSDKSGSATVTKEGFINCRQCSRKVDLFEWYAEKNNITAWDACKAIGDMMSVSRETKKHRGRPPSNMTAEILHSSVEALWDSDQADGVRKFLKSRKLDDPQMLEKFGVGYIAGYLVFSQRTSAGYLRGCYRAYTPGGKPAWMWKGSTKGGTLGFWPYLQVPKEGVIWLMEGEFDVLTAWLRLKLQDQGIYCVTWTGGAGSPIKPYSIPDAWRGREIHIVPDNDVFQGPVPEDYRAPDDKKRLEMLMRHKNLMNNVAPSFLAQNCKVFLRSIPIDPLETWGGDFRDWVDQGGRDLSELKPYLFKDLRPAAPPPVETDFMGVFELANKDVKFSAEVATIDADGVTLPSCIHLNCEMNSMPYCGGCKAVVRFPNGVIHGKDYPDDIAKAMLARDFDKYIMQHVVGKPSACVHAKLEVQEYESIAKWNAVHDDMEETNERSIIVLSKDKPTLSGEIQVTGRVHHANKKIMVMADEIKQLDQAQIDLSPFFQELLHVCPHNTEDPGLIQDFLSECCSDLSFNVTKIYGREPIHIAHELLSHSALRMKVDDLVVRAWLDIAVVGPTRTAKSMTFQRLMDHHRLGTWQNCGENISRAGLTMGGERQEGGYKLKPGLFPRNHKKMLVLDEFHDVVKEGILKFLQGARDEGKVYASKVYGSRVMAAAVRFCTISNFPYDKEKFRFLCEHLQAIYGTPECLSRTDFGLIVPEEPTESGLVEAEHVWTSEMVRALTLRAWAMDESMVHIDPKAIKYAKQKCKEWTGYYAPCMPLFTPEEKHLSILRIAIAVANRCFSHITGEPYHAKVNVGHVEWAADWLQKTWEWSEYEQYSIVVERKKVLEKPFDAEIEISVGLSLRDPEDASTLLPDFLGGFSASQAGAILGKEHYDTMKWINKMIRLGVMFQSKDTRNGYYTEIKPTKAGDQLLRNMIMCADNYPEEWGRRHSELRRILIERITPTITPMNESREALRNEWQSREDSN